jgi:hypothetical protein
MYLGYYHWGITRIVSNGGINECIVVAHVIYGTHGQLSMYLLDLMSSLVPWELLCTMDLG